MDDYEDKQIVFYRDSERFYGVNPLHDYNVGVVYEDGVAFDMRGYLYRHNSCEWALYLYERDGDGDSCMNVVTRFEAGTALSDMTSVLYSMVLLGMDTGETELEAEARIGR